MIEKNNLNVYHGTAPSKTHSIISKVSNHVISNGICLNMFEGYSKIKESFEQIENYNLNIFLDNGSFERLHKFFKGVISESDYFNYEKGIEFFDYITAEYEKLLNESIHAENIVLTIPEIILNSKLTMNLQEKYLEKYIKLQQKYNFKIIIALQFNPNSDNWINEIKSNLKWINKHIPESWLIGIPFGNDFKLISNNSKKSIKNFNLICDKIRNITPNHKSHLFACGTITKIKNYVMENRDIIISIDASSVNVWSKYAHYLSTISESILDIRYLKGTKKNCKISTINKKRKDIYLDCGMSYKSWSNLDFYTRFRINLTNFQTILKKYLIKSESKMNNENVVHEYFEKKIKDTPAFFDVNEYKDILQDFLKYLKSNYGLENTNFLNSQSNIPENTMSVLELKNFPESYYEWKNKILELKEHGIVNRLFAINLLGNGKEQYQLFFKAILISYSKSRYIDIAYLKEWISRFESGYGLESMDIYRKTIYETLKKV